MTNTKTMLFYAFLLINGLVSVAGRATNSADYDGGDSDAMGGSTVLDDAALLETELTADKQQNTLDSLEEVRTEKNTINTTTQLIEKRADISYIDSEEYSDEMESDVPTTTTTELYYDMPATTPAMKSLTKDYTRKGKKQVYATKTAADYMEEEEEDNMRMYQTYQTTQAAEEHLEPFAMKYYDSEEKSTHEDVDSLEVHSNNLPEYQQLPVVESVGPRFNADALEPIARQPIVVQAAPGLPAFLFSFTNAPPTKSSNVATMTATPAHYPTQSIITTMSPLLTTTIMSTTSSSTSSRPVGKQGKQINIPTRRKLLPHEQLRNYIEDAYIRMPLAVIVDPSMESLQKTKALWREALHTNLNIKIVLVALNDSGEPSVFAFNNTQQFLTGLNSVKQHKSGNAFIGIMHAAELIPYDSAVFISTADVPQHIDLVQDAAITLLQRRIRGYFLKL